MVSIRWYLGYLKGQLRGAGIHTDMLVQSPANSPSVGITFLSPLSIHTYLKRSLASRKGVMYAKTVAAMILFKPVTRPVFWPAPLHSQRVQVPNI